MTHCKCFPKDGRNVEKFQKGLLDHTNRECHLKKIVCCYAHNSFKKDESPQRAKCEKCCCVMKYCNQERPQHLDDYDKHRKPEKTNKFPCKETSPEKIICDVCYCLLKNCCCRENNPSKMSRPRTLTRDLPLYDEKSHLLGYIKKGAVIDHPSCARSRDGLLGDTEAQNLREEANGARCMSSCRYAQGVRRHNRTTAVPRWTTQSAFQYATLVDRNHSPNRSKKKNCPC